MSEYLAGKPAPEAQIKEWAEQFVRDGCLFIQNVLPPDWCAQMRDDLDSALENNPNGLNSKSGDGLMHLCHRMFEISKANLRLFDMEPMVSLAEALLGRGCHVIHNNSFTTKPGGGITTWHQDDPPHLLVTDGEPPTNIRMPPILFTSNYYLTDVEDAKYGGTETIPGSHLFGANPPAVMEGSKWESRIRYNCGKAGSVVLFNCQVWHRGGPNKSDRTRYITQVTYGRRIVGHKYYPFMNYVMPEEVYRDANPRLKRLLGFLDHGAYG